MNLQGIIFLIIGGVVIIGGGLYLVNSTPNDDQQGVVEEEAMTNEDFSDANSLRALIALGRDLTCDFVHDDPETGRSEGTVFLSGERMRGDFRITANGTEMESHVIRNGSTGYTWGTTPMGTVAIMFDISQEDDIASSNEGESVDLDQNLEFECSAWSVDESKFAPPSDLDFQNVSAQMQMTGEVDASANGAQCAACEQIPDASSKGQCKVALGCS